MNRFIQKISLVLVFSLAIPAGVFASGLGEPTPDPSFGPAVSSLVHISVVSAQALPVIPMTFMPASTATSCDAVSGSLSSDMLQNTDMVNLNLPASCFEMMPGRASTYAFQPLRVVQSSSHSTVAVESSARISGQSSLLPAPITSGTALPVAVFAIVAVFAWDERKNITRSFRKQFSHTHNSQLSELPVLRC